MRVCRGWRRGEREGEEEQVDCEHRSMQQAGHLRETIVCRKTRSERSKDKCCSMDSVLLRKDDWQLDTCFNESRDVRRQWARCKETMH